MEKVKNITERVVKTFIQAFVSALSIDSLFGVTDLDTLKRVLVSIAIAALAAGISAVWNLIQSYVNGKLDKITTTEEEDNIDE